MGEGLEKLRNEICPDFQTSLSPAFNFGGTSVNDMTESEHEYQKHGSLSTKDETFLLQDISESSCFVRKQLVILRITTSWLNILKARYGDASKE